MVRKIYTTKFRQMHLSLDNKTSIDIIFLVLNGVAMIIPLIYVFTSYLDFADYSIPGYFGLLGAILFLIGIIMLWRSHEDLGKSWTPTLGIRENHLLVTGGIFTYIRHPMYSAHLFWALGQILILNNWIAGPCFLLVQIPFYIYRIEKEEKMMIKQFGEKYISYMKSTGRFLPKIIKK